MHPSGMHPASSEAHNLRVLIAKRRYVAALACCKGCVEIANEAGLFCFGIARVHNGGNELGSRRMKHSSKEPEFDKVIREAVAELRRENKILIVEEGGKLFLWLRSKYDSRQKDSKGPLPGYRRGERNRHWRRAVAAMKAA